MNQRLLFSVLAGGFCGLVFGYDIGAISSTAPDLRAAFSLSPAALGLAVSSALFGTIAGSIAAGFASEFIDHRHVLRIAGLLYIAGATGSAVAVRLIQFTIARVLCGLAIGLISVVAPMYLAEISPAKLRGRIVGFFQFNLSIAVVLAFVAGYIVSNHLLPALRWRFLLAGGILPALLFELFLLGASPSPRWLAVHGRFREVRSTFASLGFPEPEIDEARTAAALRDVDACSRVKLFSREYARPIVLATTIAVFNQLTGVNALWYYILDVFKDLGSGRLNGRLDAIAVSTLSLGVTMVAVLVIDKVGRKPLLLSGAVGMGICLALLPAIRTMHWPLSTVTVVLAFYNACFGFSQGAVIWVYLSEIFPLPVRARGQSFGGTVHWTASAFVVGVFPTIARHLGERVYVLLAVLMILQFLTILFVYPETRHRHLEALAIRHL